MSNEAPFRAEERQESTSMQAAELLLEIEGEARRHRVPPLEQSFTFAQAAVLWNVDEEPRPMSALAKVLNCDNSNVTGLVDKLESRGMLVREASTQDRRVKLVSLTKKGRALKDRVRGLMLAEGQSWISLLDDEDQKTLVRILQTGCERLRALSEG